LFNTDFTTKQILSFNTVLPVLKLDQQFIEVETPEGIGLIDGKDIELSDEFGAFKQGSMQGVIDNAKLLLIYLIYGEVCLVMVMTALDYVSTCIKARISIYLEMQMNNMKL